MQLSSLQACSRVQPSTFDVCTVPRIQVVVLTFDLDLKLLCSTRGTRVRTSDDNAFTPTAVVVCDVRNSAIARWLKFWRWILQQWSRMYHIFARTHHGGER